SLAEEIGSRPSREQRFHLSTAAEFERTMIRQRVKAGLKRAVAQGLKLGRPKIDSATERRVRKQLAKGVGILWKPWWVTGGYAPSVQQALSARSGGGLAAAWARGVQAGSAGEPGDLLEGLRHARGNPAGALVGSRHRQQLNGEFIAALLRDFRQ